MSSETISLRSWKSKGIKYKHTEFTSALFALKSYRIIIIYIYVNKND